MGSPAIRASAWAGSRWPRTVPIFSCSWLLYAAPQCPQITHVAISISAFDSVESVERSLRNKALAERLDTAFTEVSEIFIGLLRDTPDASETEAAATASTLAYTFVGYVTRLATQASEVAPLMPLLSAP